MALPVLCPSGAVVIMLMFILVVIIADTYIAFAMHQPLFLVLCMYQPMEFSFQHCDVGTIFVLILQVNLGNIAAILRVS